MTRAEIHRPAAPVVLLIAGPGVAAEVVETVAGRATAETGVPALVIDPAGDGLAPALAAAMAGGSGVVLLDARWLAPATVYGDLVADPRDEPAVLGDRDGTVVGVRLAAGDEGPGSVFGSGPGSVTGSDLLAAAATAARSRGARELAPGSFPTAWTDDGLAAALAAVDAADEPALRLRRASRSDDGFLSAFLVRPLSRQVTRQAVRLGLRPAQITAVSLGLGIASALAFAGGTTGWRTAGAVLLFCSLVVDCVDGEVARYTRTFSPLGGWLDVASDRVKENAVYAGLVVGADRVGGADLWPAALAAMAVLVVRHFVDFGFAASPATRSSGSAVAGLSEATSARPGLIWVKRAVILPVGERTVLLVVLAPLLGAKPVLWLLFGLGVLAGAYTSAGRLGRSWSAGREPALEAPGAQRLVAQCDASPLPEAGLLVTSRLGWLAPAAARTLELVAVGGTALLVGGDAALAGAYALLAVAAIRDYDLAYRQRLTGVVRPRDGLTQAGWPVRAVGGALLVAWAGSGPTWPPLVAAAVLGLVALGVNVRWWRGRLPGRPAD
jgi:phosphatidylglycerophosphate synthase